jgi:hypothetical protein
MRAIMDATSLFWKDENFIYFLKFQEDASFQSSDHHGWQKRAETV